MSSKEDEKLVKISYSFYTVFKIVAIITLSCFNSGYNIGVSNISMPNVAYSFHDLDLTTFQSIHGAVFAIGGVVGSLISGKIANKYGRKNGLRLVSIVTFTSCGLTLVPSEASFFIGRFIAGITAGMGCSIPPLYINEVVPEDIRGKLGSMVQFQVTFGIFCSNLLCLVLPTYRFNTPQNQLWVLVYAFPVIPAALQIVFLSFVYNFDTPQWLSRCQDSAEQERALKAIYIEGWESYLDKPQEDRKLDPNYSELFFIGRYRSPLLVGCMMSVIQQMVGINAFIFYSNQMYAEINGSLNFANYFTSALDFVNMCSTMICLAFVEKYGRKVLMIQGCIGMGFCHLFAFWFSFLSLSRGAIIAFMMIYIAFFESSAGPVLWIYCGETLTDRGIGLAIGTNWFFTAVVTALFGPIAEAVGIWFVFLGFSVICFFSAAYCLVFMVETKGKTREQLEKMLDEVYK